MKHIYNYLNPESPKVIEQSVRAIIDDKKTYLLTFCRLNDYLYLDVSNISVECDINPLMCFAKQLVESIPNIEFTHEFQMTDDFNYQCFVIHQNTPPEIVQENI